MLSALSFLHLNGVHVDNLYTTHIWIRDDFSLALSSFVHASVPIAALEDKDFAGSGSQRDAIKRTWHEYVEVENRKRGGHRLRAEEGLMREDDFLPDQEAPKDANLDSEVKLDLFHWATLVFRFMTDAFSDRPSGLEPGFEVECDGCHVDPGYDVHGWGPNTVTSGQANTNLRDWAQMHTRLNDIGPDRLGWVLIKAWMGEYETAEDAMRDVQSAVEEAGLRMVREDEIELEGGKHYEDVFEVVNDNEGSRTGFRIADDMGAGTAVTKRLE